MILFFFILCDFENSYATVKKEPPARPPAPARRKRSSRSPGDTLQAENSRAAFKDSPFPERQKRSFNILPPARPPRRGSSSSLIDQHKYVDFKMENRIV